MAVSIAKSCLVSLQLHCQWSKYQRYLLTPCVLAHTLPTLLASHLEQVAIAEDISIVSRQLNKNTGFIVANFHSEK